MFSKPNTLLYLQRSSLMLAGKRLSAARLEIPEEIVKNLEILDQPKLVKLIDQFLRDHGTHGRRILLVLDGSIVFQKAIELDQTGKPDLLTKGFIDAMPFEPGQRACLAVQTDMHLRLFATNSHLYAAVIDAVHSASAGRLLAITPGSAYSFSSADRSITAAAERFFADSNVHKLADFRTVIPV